MFYDNNAGFEVFIGSACQPGHIIPLSRTRTHCIQCSENWRQYLIGIFVAAFIAGIVLVIFMLALNMTVAIGTLSGIFFYAHIVTVNADTYFLPFKSTNFVTVFISWLNLDIGFDVCFITYAETVVAHVSCAFLQLAFPVYVTCLVIIIIVASEYSQNFAKVIGKGNPVAVLATMILLSSAKLLNEILSSFSSLYWNPALGSHNVDVRVLGSVKTVIEEAFNSVGFKAFSYLLFLLIIVFFFPCMLFLCSCFLLAVAFTISRQQHINEVGEISEAAPLSGALSCSL
ncbi:MAG: hypothetical protein MJE68_20410 [Proteobacteria bacterium]|nr:hypothetical protein [Pseudomonadota bacterium]